MYVTRLPGAFEPIHSEIRPAQPRMYQRECVGRHVSLGRHGFERVQHLLGLPRAPQPASMYPRSASTLLLPPLKCYAGCSATSAEPLSFA
jgi:hypothetical protein